MGGQAHAPRACWPRAALLQAAFAECQPFQPCDLPQVAALLVLILAVMGELGSALGAMARHSTASCARLLPPGAHRISLAGFPCRC